MTLTIVVASVLTFYRLGRSSTGGDEAQYALAVEHMRKTGNWLDVSPVPPTVSFQKPPLYMWLNVITYPVLERLPVRQPEGRYRVWSGIFGIAACGLTCWLAGRMFGRAQALLAGLMMAANDAFLFFHGSRWGTFDSAITLCHLGAFAVWWAKRGSWPAWIGIGVICGLQSMLKPMAGVPTLGMIIICELLARFIRGRGAGVASIESKEGDAGVADTWQKISLNVGTAIVFAAMVTTPWYLAEWLRHGEHFVNEMFYSNLYKRATEGVDVRHLKSHTYYITHVSRATPGFILLIPAALYMLWQCFRHSPRQFTWMAITFGALGWLILFSLTGSKADHYVFPAYPFVALGIAGMVCDTWFWCEHRWGIVPTARTTGILLILAGTLAICVRIIGWRVSQQSYNTPMSKLYRAHEADVAKETLRTFFLEFPETHLDWRMKHELSPGDCYYLELLSGKYESVSRQRLAEVLQDPRPTLIVAPLGTDLELATSLDTNSSLDRVVTRAKYAVWRTRSSTTGVSPVPPEK